MEFTFEQLPQAVNQELNKIMFMVLPVNKDETLNRIEERLCVYIDASGMDIKLFETSTDKKHVILIKCEANTYPLKGQLLLANAIIEAQEATISALRLSNNQMNKNIYDAAKNEEEVFLDGIVTIKKFEGKGFAIDFAKIVRRLKRFFKKTQY